MFRVFQMLAIIVTSTFGLSTAHAEVDNSIVIKWIATGSLASGCKPHPSAEADLTKNIETGKLFASWKHLKKCRDDGNSLDPVSYTHLTLPTIYSV